MVFLKFQLAHWPTPTEPEIVMEGILLCLTLLTAILPKPDIVAAGFQCKPAFLQIRFK